jgi:hypothetical protein
MKGEGTTPRGAEGPVQLAKKVALSWGITPAGESSDIYLALTDETGAVSSHPIGRFRGTCAVAAPSAGMSALTAVRCTYGGTGTELHAVLQGGETIIVLSLIVDQGVAPDPMARQEVTRITIPLGAAVEASY